MNRELREALQMTNLVSLVSDEKKGIIPLEKELTKHLHSLLWTLRGKYGVSKVSLLIYSDYFDTGIGGDPKEEVIFYTLVETVQVIIYGYRGVIEEKYEVFREVTQTGDFLSTLNVFESTILDKRLHGTRAFTFLLDKVVKSRATYFKGLKVEVSTPFD